MASSDQASLAQLPTSPTNRCGPDPSRVWTPVVVRCIASFLPPNEVACSLRLVDSATAAQFAAPAHATVTLSQPVPHHAFAAHWTRPDAFTALSRWERRELLRLTSLTGDVSNLGLLLPLLLRHDPLAVKPAVLAAAAGRGHLAALQLLMDGPPPQHQQQQQQQQQQHGQSQADHQNQQHYQPHEQYQRCQQQQQQLQQQQQRQQQQRQPQSQPKRKGKEQRQKLKQVEQARPEQPEWELKLSAVDAFVAAAEAGRRDVCEWLLRRERKRSAGLQPDELACSGLCPAAAVRGGLTDLAEQMATPAGREGLWLTPGTPALQEDAALGLLRGAAEVCDAGTFELLLGRHGGCCLTNPLARLWLIAAAAASPTPDWRDKFEVLHERRFRRQTLVGIEVVRRVRPGGSGAAGAAAATAVGARDGPGAAGLAGAAADAAGMEPAAGVAAGALGAAPDGAAADAGAAAAADGPAARLRFLHEQHEMAMGVDVVSAAAYAGNWEALEYLHQLGMVRLDACVPRLVLLRATQGGQWGLLRKLLARCAAAAAGGDGAPRGGGGRAGGGGGGGGGGGARAGVSANGAGTFWRVTVVHGLRPGGERRLGQGEVAAHAPARTDPGPSGAAGAAAAAGGVAAGGGGAPGVPGTGGDGEEQRAPAGAAVATPDPPADIMSTSGSSSSHSAVAIASAATADAGATSAARADASPVKVAVAAAATAAAAAAATTAAAGAATATTAIAATSTAIAATSTTGAIASAVTSTVALSPMQTPVLALGSHRNPPEELGLGAAPCGAAGAWLLCEMVLQPDCSLQVFEWLAAGQGPRVQPYAAVLMGRAAARRDGWRWLQHLRQCYSLPWRAVCFNEAAGAGASEAQLAWMVADGCPVPCDGEPYVRAAAVSDVAMLRCLQRLRRVAPPSAAAASGTEAVTETEAGIRNGAKAGTGGRARGADTDTQNCGAGGGGSIAAGILGEACGGGGYAYGDMGRGDDGTRVAGGSYSSRCRWRQGVPCVPSVLLRAALAAGRPGEDRLPGLQALLDLGLVGQVDWDHVKEGMEQHQHRGASDASRQRVLAWVKAKRKQARREERERARRRGGLERVAGVFRTVLTWARALRQRDSSSGV